MYAKKMTYTDYDGNERTETFYFNLTKAELTEMELSSEGGLSKMIQRIIDSQDSTRIITIFKDIILRSYGEKSPDGKRFIKNGLGCRFGGRVTFFIVVEAVFFHEGTVLGENDRFDGRAVDEQLSDVLHAGRKGYLLHVGTTVEETLVSAEVDILARFGEGELGKTRVPQRRTVDGT